MCPRRVSWSVAGRADGSKLSRGGVPVAVLVLEGLVVRGRPDIPVYTERRPE